MGTMVKPSNGGNNFGASKKSGIDRFANDAKARIGDGIEERRSKSAEAISDAAEAIRLSSHALGGNALMPYIQKAADQLQRVAKFVREADPNEISKEVESFARREPLLFLGGAAAIGLVGGRFMRASAPTVEADASATRTPKHGSNGASAPRSSKRANSQA